MNPLLHLEGRQYDHKTLTLGEFKSEPPRAAAVLHFCHAWLTKQPTFTLFTSGSTGPPKPITVSRSAMAASARLTQQALNLQPDMNTLVAVDTGFVAGQMMLVRGLEIGMNLYVVPPSANPFRDLPREVRVDFAAFVPYQLETILASPDRHRLDEMKFVIVGGAPLEASTIQKLQSSPCQFFATYGMTETLTHIALRPLNGPNATPRFRALPGIQIETDSRNCLVIRAPHLDEPVNTNDVVELFPNGEFVWLGRWDNVINSGGVKIHPELVEQKLHGVFQEAGMPTRFFVTSRPHPKLHEQVVLVVEGHGHDLMALWPKIRSALSRYEMPKQLLVVPNFALTNSGKIDRRATMESNPQPLPIPEEV
jgi:O-succinylbenzoic acid--CoA ligase